MVNEKQRTFANIDNALAACVDYARLFNNSIFICENRYGDKDNQVEYNFVFWDDLLLPETACARYFVSYGTKKMYRVGEFSYYNRIIKSLNKNIVNTKVINLSDNEYILVGIVKVNQGFDYIYNNKNNICNVILYGDKLLKLKINGRYYIGSDGAYTTGNKGFYDVIVDVGINIFDDWIEFKRVLKNHRINF